MASLSVARSRHIQFLVDPLQARILDHSRPAQQYFSLVYGGDSQLEGISLLTLLNCSLPAWKKLLRQGPCSENLCFMGYINRGKLKPVYVEAEWVAGGQLVTTLTTDLPAPQSEHDADAAADRVIELLPAGVFHADLKTGKVQVNQMLREITGCSRTESLASWLEFLKNQIPEAARTGRNIDDRFVVLLQHKDGSHRWVKVVVHLSNREATWLLSDINDYVLEEEMFRYMFGVCSEPCFVHNEMVVIDCNKAAVWLMGCKDKSELVGRDIISLSPEYQSDGRRSIETARDIYKKAETISFGWLYRPLYEQDVSIEVVISSTIVCGCLVFIIVWRHDKEARLNPEELLQAKKLAMLGTDAKVELYGMLTNGQSSLHGAMRLAEMLTSKTLSLEQRADLQTISAYGSVLLKVLNDLIDFGQIDAAGGTPEMAPFQLRTELNEVLRGLHFAAEKKGVLLSCEVDQGVHESLLDTPSILQQILLNFILIFLELMNGGSISMKARRCAAVQVAASSRSSQAPVLFEVIATPITSVTDPRSIFAKKGHRAAPGYDTARALAAFVGGSVTLSTENKYIYTFHWVAELFYGDCKTLKDLELESLNFLIVDDNKVNQLVLFKILRKLGVASITSAWNGQEAVDSYISNRQDVILLDIHMPVMDGYEAARQIRKLQGSHRPLIIANTADAGPHEEKKCREAGMNAFLRKPIRWQDVAGIVYRV